MSRYVTVTHISTFNTHKLHTAAGISQVDIVMHLSGTVVLQLQLLTENISHVLSPQASHMCNLQLMFQPIELS